MVSFSISQVCDSPKLYSQALKQLRTSEFKPYVIFVKPAMPEKRKTPPMSPAGEDSAAPLVSCQLTLF